MSPVGLHPILMSVQYGLMYEMGERPVRVHIPNLRISHIGEFSLLVDIPYW